VDEREPDYRFTLANERTVLAWMRTSLALMAAGVAVVQFAPLFGLRTPAGVGLAALSVVTAVAAVLRWRAVQVAMRRGQPLPRSAVPWVLGAGLAALGTGVCVALLVP
jgi:putative membrane protein